MHKWKSTKTINVLNDKLYDYSMSMNLIDGVYDVDNHVVSNKRDDDDISKLCYIE